MRRIFVLLLLTMAALPAQSPKPVYDPDSKAGFLIQHIEQERDATEKLHYMEQFAAQFPSHPAIGWVYDQLQPALFEVKDYEGALRIAALRIAVEPDSLEAAKIALRSAESLHRPPAMIEWAEKVWKLSAGATSAEAKEIETYADFCAYTAVEQTDDPKTRLAVLQEMEQRNPSSPYLRTVAADYYRIYHQLGDQEKAFSMAERALSADPNNPEMLLAVADYQFHKSNAHSRQEALAESVKAIDILEKTPKPESLSDEDWNKRKNEALGLAYYLAGMSASMLNNFAKADAMLRADLPLIKGNEAQEAAVLYHLGMANYRLAEAGNDRSRPVDAIRFLRRCAALHSPFQEQAARYVDAIRAEYSLP